MILDYFKFSWSNIKNRKVRSWLTMLGIFIGIAAVVGLISLSQGMNNAINDQFAKIGSNRITVSPGGSFFGPGGSSLVVEKLLDDDFEVTSKVRGVKTVLGMYGETVAVKFKDETQYFSIMGVPTDTESLEEMEKIGFFDMDKGRQLKTGERYGVNVGYAIAKDKFDKPLKVGDKLEIESKTFEIVGTQKEAGTGVHDVLARISFDTAMDIFEKDENEYSMFAVVTKEGFEPGEVADDIKEDLRDSRDVKEDEEDFTVQTIEQTIAGMTTILGVVQAVLIGIAGISLLVGGIGIMNTMYTSVVQRTPEIGVMKAIGARNSSIMTIFLIESGILGLAGGIIGIILGVAMSKVVEIVAAQAGMSMLKAYFPWYLIVGALVFSVLVGMLSGILPARQAAKMHPVDALRYSE